MAENSKIEWTTHTFNPWIGCAKVAAGCTHCYAEAMVNRYQMATWGPHGTRVNTSEANWRKPLKWNRDALQSGERPRVFCASLADVFEDFSGWVLDMHGNVVGQCLHCDCRELGTTPACPPHCARCGGPMTNATLDDLRRDLFALIDATPHLDWLLLTKRPENVLRMWPQARHMPAGDPYRLDDYRPNVWLLTSIATQADADRNVPLLLRCRDLAPVLGLSIEPMVGPVDIGQAIYSQHDRAAMDNQYLEPLGGNSRAKVDWVIVGGESGPQARPCNAEWARGIIEQCADASCPVFVKQLGAHVVARNDDVAEWFDHVGHLDMEATERFQGAIGRVRGFRDPKGGDTSEWPSDVRVREFPATTRHRPA